MEEKKIIKYNLLTQGLLAAGYTVDDHPDYVVLRDGYGTRKSLDNYHGGFTAGCCAGDSSARAA